MIEAWGRGIERILETCRVAQVPEPELRYEPSGLWIEFSFPPSKETRVETRQRILDVLRENPHATLIEVASAIGKSRTAVERAASRLVAEGKLRFVGPRKRGRWEVLQ